MCFDIGNMTVPVDKRSVALGTCRLRLAQSLILALSRIMSERQVRSQQGEALIDVFRPREDRIAH